MQPRKPDESTRAAAINLFLTIKTRPGLNAREHWAQKARRNRAERTVSRLAFASSVRGRTVMPCVITLVRVSAGSMDEDNLAGAMKAIRDGIADALGINDNDPRVQWRYAQRKCRRGEFGVVVEVTP